ncbi:MAG: phosphoribosylamine--glycine ligase [Bacteroidales bacterium]|jgi:phosphoribosylamine--glycine ligase
MKVLVIGSGAREHAIIWKLSQNSRIEKIFCIPGNPGVTELATCVNINTENIHEICEFALENDINFTIPISESVIAGGICDVFRENGLQIFGPSKEAAKIGTNRAFAKKFMFKHKIPTPRYGLFDKENAAIDYARKSNYPIIVRYDASFTSGEESFFCETFSQAKKAIEKSFANLNKTTVIEEYFSGSEITFTVITDGYNAVPMPYVHVYKRVLEGDGGAITHGVGAFAPVGKIDFKLEGKIAGEIVFPTLDSLRAEGNPYEGFLSINIIMNDKNEIKAIDFQPTIGDPEAQTVLPLINDDLFDVLYSTSIGALGDDYENLNINDMHSVSVYLLSGNYPSKPKKNVVIEGIENIDDDDLLLFYGETAMNPYYEVVTNGSRVMSFTSTASTLNKAHERVYESIDIVKFESKKFRKDIANSFLSDRKLFL